MLARLAATPPERLLSRPQVSAAQALSGYGVPPGAVEGFLRPLLAALLGDPALTSSSRCADLALHAFATGRLCLPEGGADALPELLAAGLPPGSVRTGVRVTAVSTTSVTTREAGEIGCRAVVLATGARSAAALLPGLRVPPITRRRCCTTPPTNRRSPNRSCCSTPTGAGRWRTRRCSARWTPDGLRRGGRW